MHSVVSFDFAVSQIPGWHTTIFPPYFVAGAIYGGFAMVICLAVPARQLFGLKDIITLRHMDNMAKITLATSMMVGYCVHDGIFRRRLQRQSARAVHVPQPRLRPVWLELVRDDVLQRRRRRRCSGARRCRTNMLVLWIVGMFGNIGMWFERFEIIITSLTRDFLPSSWHAFWPTWVDLCTLAGSFGLFMTLFLLFCRLSADGGDGGSEDDDAAGACARPCVARRGRASDGLSSGRAS